MRSANEIIDAAGGPKAVADRSNAARPHSKLSEWAVRKWPKNGIPEWHWPVLRELIPDLTTDELHAINERIRASRPSSAEGAAA